ARINRKNEGLVDHPLTEFIGPDLAAWLARQESNPPPPSGDAAATIEISDPLLKGSFIVTTTDLLNHARERIGRVVVARDLTSHTRLEAEREELRKRLTQSEKLAALGQVGAGSAHERNSPLPAAPTPLALRRA